MANTFDKNRLREIAAFKRPNHAGAFLTGNSVNAWVAFRDSEGKSIDEVMRKDTA